MTHQKAQCGLKSDTPVGQGGTLDTVTHTIIGADAPMSVKTPPPPGVPPPPDYLPEMEDELIVKNTVKALSPRIVAVHGHRDWEVNGVSISNHTVGRSD